MHQKSPLSRRCPELYIPPTFTYSKKPSTRFPDLRHPKSPPVRKLEHVLSQWHRSEYPPYHTMRHTPCVLCPMPHGTGRNSFIPSFNYPCSRRLSGRRVASLVWDCGWDFARCGMSTRMIRSKRGPGAVLLSLFWKHCRCRCRFARSFSHSFYTLIRTSSKLALGGHRDPGSS